MSFEKEKRQVLLKNDLSKKGSVDAFISTLVDEINASDKYYTTSSCSGRINVVSKSSFKEKKDCIWLFTSHEQVDDISPLFTALDENEFDIASFCFEPFALHVCCDSLQSAQNLVSIAIESGFRNSGITVSKKQRVMAAVRSTHSLRAPLGFEGKLLVSQEYIELIVKQANEMFLENFNRIEKFHKKLKKIL